MSKAKQTWLEAKHLVEKDCACGAANRLYYALYQAIREKFESGPHPPDHYDSRVNYWTHSIVKRCCKDVGVSDADIISKAFDLREQADYKLAPVHKAQVLKIWLRAQNVLVNDLGVSL